MIGAPLLLGDDGYNISRSVRLRSSASAYFNRTPGSAGNRRTWTWSGWIKRGALGGNNAGLLTALDSAGVRSGIMYESNNQLIVYNNNTTSARYQLAQIHRDPSAWYHIVVAYDTTQATSSDRIKVWVNSVLNSATSGTLTYPSQNYDGSINNTVAHNIGRDVLDNTYLDGYLTEINFIDGQALTPSSFGETDVLTGVWKPKKYTGTYGTNGFFLNFSDNSSNTATTIGKDYSGNGNNWTPNNISVTAGVTYDSMLDVPTMWDDGGNGRGNYAVLNAVAGGAGTYNALANGNLRLSNTTNSGTSGTNISPFVVSSGKWYWEVTATGVPAAPSNPGVYVGIADASNFLFGQPGGNGPASVGGYAYRSYTGNKVSAGGDVAYGATYTTNDVIGVALDLTAGTLTFYKNNVSQGTAYTGLTGSYGALGSVFQGGQLDFNFGQRPFTYTPPTGFKALNTQNLPEPTIKKGASYFDISTWTGDQSARTITNSGGMQPDFLWTKSRSAAEDHRLSDSVRGGNGTVLGTLASNTTGAEAFDTDVTGFTSSGFSIRAGTNSPNVTGRTYVGWQWKESATAGCDIVTYTGTGVARTVAHSLGVAPSMMIVKSRSYAGSDWDVYHSALGATKRVFLNTTAAAQTTSVAWNDTAPTSSVFTVGTGANVNLNTQTYVAYLFAEVAGFSKFGSYTGNGSADGPFVYTGFRPRWVMVKATSGSLHWWVWDTGRNTYNAMNEALVPDLSVTEQTPLPIDCLSNGFKLRTSNGEMNTNGTTFIYAAFAENPFKLSLAR